MESNTHSLYSTTSELEKQLRSLLRKDPNAHAIPALRNRIRENYKSIILNDFPFALSKEVESNLWKVGFYKSIEEYRKAIRKFATATANIKKDKGHPAGMRNQLRNKCSEFREFLAGSMAFYTDLISRLEAKYNLALDGSVVYDPSLAPNEEVSNGTIKRSGNKAYLSCHKSFIFLGDLTRYQRDLYGEPEARQKDWSAAARYYKRALLIMPDSGNPHNQLAVVATYSDDELEAVYRYFRSLAVKVPFTTANDNLHVLFEKNNAKLIAVLQPNKTEKKQGHISRREKSPGPPDEATLFALRFVRLHGILFTASALETFGDLKALTLKHLDGLLSRGCLDAPKLLKLLVINIFTFHRSLREGDASMAHRNAHLLAFDVTTHILTRMPYGEPFPPSPILPHLSVFLDWALHHSSLLDPVSPQEEESHRQLAQVLAPILNAIIQATEGLVERLPPTLAEECDLSAFLPLSTTYAPVPPPSAPSPLPQRLAKIRSAINALIERRPSWAFLLYDENSSSFIPTSNYIASTPHKQSPSPQSQSMPSGQDEEEKENEDDMASNEHSSRIEAGVEQVIAEDDEEEEEEEGEEEVPKRGMSMDLDSISPILKQREEGEENDEEVELDEGDISLSLSSLPSPAYKFNDDEVNGEDELEDEVILFNPFHRPNQNQPSTPIGGERSFVQPVVSPFEQQQQQQQQQQLQQQQQHQPQQQYSPQYQQQYLQQQPSPAVENHGAAMVPPKPKPALYTPPHRQGGPNQRNVRPPPGFGPSAASHGAPNSNNMRPPPGFGGTSENAKKITPPPGFAARGTPPGLPTSPNSVDSLFTAFQASPQGDSLSFFGFGSPTPNAMSPRQNGATPSTPTTTTTTTATAPATHEGTAMNKQQQSWSPMTSRPISPPRSGGPHTPSAVLPPAQTTSPMDQGWGPTSIAWPFAPHRAAEALQHQQQQQQQQQQQGYGTDNSKMYEGGMWMGSGPWHSPLFSQNQHQQQQQQQQQWNNGGSIKTANPYLT